ncbi:hypothetical protein EV143_11723 [Flavobacterium chryseum]|uniref:ParB/Sulfiredoxin domain-containing protein n=3 Tax=Flavobacterium TaxID=237 RepID=A0A940XIH4_9FLAO|nr:hypothetical protein [Flavobacterium]MBP4139793.1 hypothetical protein [Flavobacterium geliluteum]TCN49916.1 hypothetical protein EV142_11911 [Flavobacterium circumlabens]TDO68880.1 hypothetical protein EV143_11723 [Flavobacterium sp. P3160]TEB41699.1 hypothetical protein D0809_24095 [Flavobacterium circumlabens]
MYIDYSLWEHYEYSLNSLHLDLNNPRLKYREVNLNQPEILKFLIANEKVYELAKKISEEGYFVGEEPIICIENDKKIILEGNRRTGALKLLQDPSKYLSKAKANILLQNILKNNFPVGKKLKCYIAPNRLLANPIIYERHKGDSLQKWKTGNQYAFVADMYYEDGLSIEDIADVLNESITKIVKPLKAYNLFLEGKELLEKEEDIIIEIDKFDFTNLERFYSYDEARLLLGIDFDDENGELIINIPREEFDKRLLIIFKIIIDSERFSREFNKEDDKKEFVKKLKANADFNLSVPEKQSVVSKATKQKSNLDEEKAKINQRRKKAIKNTFFERVIPKDTDIYFNNDKLDSLFLELKSLPNEKFYSFALLLRTYLEQSLYYYLKTNDLFESLSDKTSKKTIEDSGKKVSLVIDYIKNNHGVQDTISKDNLMNILRFNSSKDYSNASLKIMLDYFKNYELDNFFDVQTSKNLKKYFDNVKEELDLAVHNIETFVDLTHNKRAWKHLEPLFVTLSENLNKD